MRIDISVIVVSYNTLRLTIECIQSLLAMSSRVIEVVVVDNASTDGSAETIAAHFPTVRLICKQDNAGFAKANNEAIRQCRGDYIALVNSDVKVLPGCLEELAAFLDRNEHVGLVGPRILNSDGTLQSSCRRFPSVRNGLCDALGISRKTAHSYLAGEHMFYFSHDRILEVDVLVGCFWMVRRRAFEEVGLLDEEFFMYGEDVDWCRRCWTGGWKIVFVPTGAAIHYRGASAAADRTAADLLRQQSILRYWDKHHGRIGLVCAASLLFLRHGTRYVYGLTISAIRKSSRAESMKKQSATKACLKALATGHAFRGMSVRPRPGNA